jgi:hypothetical protein
VAFRPVAGQRPEKEQVQPLLYNTLIKKTSFYATVGILLDYNNENGVFYVVRAEML